MNIIDIIAIIILALAIFLGYKKGLVGVAFRLLTFIVALILTIFLYNPITQFVIDNTELDDNIEKIIVQNMASNQEFKLTGIEYIDNYIQNTKDTGVDVLANEIAISITKVIVLIALFITIRLILFVFYKFSVVLAKLPIIKQFNKIGGVLYGILEGAVIIYFAILIASIIAPMINNMDILSFINGSIVGKIIL